AAGLLLKSSRSSSRYSSACFSGTQLVAIVVMSCRAVFTSRSEIATSPSPRISSAGFRTSSAKKSVSSASASLRGRMGTTCGVVRRTNRPMPTTPTPRSAARRGRSAGLVREEERLERERIAKRPDGHDVRLGPEDKPSDPDHAGTLHRAKEQRVGLLGSHSPGGRDVIALLVEDGVDVGETHELLDLDRPAALRSDRHELVVGDSHEVARRHLEAPHDVLALDVPGRRPRVGRARFVVALDWGLDSVLPLGWL